MLLVKKSDVSKLIRWNQSVSGFHMSRPTEMTRWVYSYGRIGEYFIFFEFVRFVFENSIAIVAFVVESVGLTALFDPVNSNRIA